LGEGLTVRGIHGENSEHLGDFYQVSNEVTLGCRREELLERLARTAELLVQHEMKARDALFEQKPDVARDLLGRALGVLQNAFILNSSEALAHLSKMRLGIDRGYFRPLGHSDLSRLMLDVQPAHLQCRGGGAMPEEKRDSMRAEVIRQRLKNVSWN
jgi:protein arginine kinase